jgi:hypothetical protein
MTRDLKVDSKWLEQAASIAKDDDGQKVSFEQALVRRADEILNSRRQRT